MRALPLILIGFIIYSCTPLPRISVRDRGEQFAQDTTISFGQYSGEPGPVSRKLTFDIRGQLEIVDGFRWESNEPLRVVVPISPDSVRRIVRFAIDAGIFAKADSVFAKQDGLTLDGPTIHHFELNAGSKSKLIKTDGSDRSHHKLIGLTNVVDHIAWERLPDAKRWRWFGRVWTLEDIK
jgi:hypothetical protein